MQICSYQSKNSGFVPVFGALKHLEHCLKANKKEEYFHLGLHSLVHIATCNYAQCIFLRHWPYISLQKLLFIFP